MKPCRFPQLRLLAGACFALALAGLVAPSAAQDTGPLPPPMPTAEALPSKPEAAPTALVAIPPAGEDAMLKDPIKLNDNPLSTVLYLLEDLTGRMVIRPQQLPTPLFTFNSRVPITKRDAIIAIESLLSLNNIAVTPLGDKFIKVVVITNIRTEAPELVLGSLLDRQASGKIVSKLFRLEHLDTTTFQNQVQPFLSPGFGAVVPFQNSNTLLVTDTISNLQRLEYVLAEVDKPRDLVTKFYTLKFAQAQAVSEKIKSLIETTRTAFNRQTGGATTSGGMPMPPGMPPPQTGGEGGDNASAGLGAALISATTSLNFDERTNQVILVTDSSSVKFYDNLIEKLDVQADPSTQIAVIQIQHAQATEVASLLSTFVSGGSSRSSSSSSSRSSTTRQTRSRETFPGLNRNTANNPSPQAAPQVAMGGGSGERNSQFSEFMTILADERSNAIVASGTLDDLNLIRELIKQIDVILPQVQIDVLIASVTLSNTVNRGIDAFSGITVAANKIVGIKGVTGPGFTIADLLINSVSGDGKKATVSGTVGLDTSKNTNNNVRVKSVPSITTTSNQEATITVAKAVPIITSAYSDVSSTVGARNSYSYQNIGLELTVKPLIGSDGTIQMEVEQSADEIDSYNTDGQPLISKRTAKSFVSVQDGEIIVLGGLQKESKGKTRNGLQLLGEIPVLGFLFGSNSRVKSRDEIIFFIQPRILRTTADADRAARTQAQNSAAFPMIEKNLRQTVVLPAEPPVK